MVAGGLNWWQALIAALVGHFIGAMLTIWNGRGGSVYHIGFPVWIRASFGMWGAMFPVFVRCVLDLVWFSIQTYFGGLFMDVMLQCIFGQSWTAIPNMLPTESSTSTRFMAAYFLYWLVQLCICFFRPHQVKWLFAVKSTTMPCACVGLFIWALVRSGGPPALGSLQTKGTYSSKLIAWTFVASINAAINGEFGPLIASEPDITRYSKHPRNQIIGVGAVAPWCATLVCLLGIITAACTQTIYGEALWNPAAILNYILAENNDSKTKFAVFCCSFVLMIGQTGTNFVANLIPFGVDATSIAPKYLNIVRSHLLCALIGGWALVPWKVLTSGAVFISCITGMGIWMGSLVGIMLADYFFVRNGNYFVEDLYTSNPNGRYWYTHGINWRAYAAYLVAVMVRTLLASLSTASRLTFPTLSDPLPRFPRSTRRLRRKRVSRLSFQDLLRGLYNFDIQRYGCVYDLMQDMAYG